MIFEKTSIKYSINRWLRQYGAEIHGIGYLQKLRKANAAKNQWERQKELLMGNASTIIDAGANIGSATTQYMQHFPGAEVHAFEPFPESFEGLQKRFTNNLRVKCQKLALGARQEKNLLNVNKSAATNSILQSGTLGVNSDISCTTIAQVEINTTTLDAYALDAGITYIDILKMDVQGYEMEVLKGAQNLLKNGLIKMIYTECYFQPQYHHQPLYHDIARMLYDFGYVLEDWYDPYFSKDTILWCDALFVLKKAF